MLGFGRFMLRERITVWRKDAWGPWWITVTALFAVASNWDTILGWFGGADRFGIAALIPRLSARSWWILWLTLTVFVLLEAVYRVARERDSLQAQIEVARRDQALSDALSDKHEFAVHELLNKKPTDDASFATWLKQENDWTKSVLDLMRAHKCTTQEIRHVHTIGLLPLLPLHRDPVIAHQLSMLAARLERIAEIARKYGE